MPTIELSMIVKNEESTLARCLETVRSIVDDIVIADTGSADATVQIARSYRARVVDVPWEDDFSKARNAVLRHGRCDWVLFLDADELLDSAEAKGIAALVANPAVFGYDVRIWNYVSTLTTRMLNRPAQQNPNRIEAARHFPGYVEHVNVRLFRRHPEILFEGRVHEGVADSMRRKGLKVAPANFIIHHLGIAEDEAEQRNRKMKYYQELGRKKLEEAPDDVLAHYELGLGELEHFHNPRGALPYFLRAIELKPDSGVLLTYAGMCLVRLGEAEKGLTLVRASLIKEALELKTYVVKMDQDSHQLVGQLKAQISTYEKKLQEVEELASRDSLTGLANRRNVEERIESRIASNQAFCIAMLDLNGFKRVNDEHGHVAGDSMLQQFAQELRSASRAGDVVGRWGGDEFMMVIDSDIEGATAQFERLQKWVFGEYTIRPGKGSGEVKIKVDAAIGLTPWQPGQTLKEIVEQADKAMYKRKEMTRSQYA